MWYFAWVLGLGFAVTLGILNAMWFELREGEAATGGTERGPAAGTQQRARVTARVDIHEAKEI